jgi:hypothetical protein
MFDEKGPWNTISAISDVSKRNLAILEYLPWMHEKFRMNYMRSGRENYFVYQTRGSKISVLTSFASICLQDVAFFDDSRESYRQILSYYIRKIRRKGNSDLSSALDEIEAKFDLSELVKGNTGDMLIRREMSYECHVNVLVSICSLMDAQIAYTKTKESDLLPVYRALLEFRYQFEKSYNVYYQTKLAQMLSLRPVAPESAPTSAS